MKNDKTLVEYLSSDGEVLTAENFSTIMKNMRTQDKIFMNADCLFVEYYDILKCPWYVLLTVINQNEKLRPILDIDQVAYMNNDAQFEWYCNRKNRNFLFDLAKAPFDKVNYDEILSILMKNKIFYDIDSTLNAKEAIDIALRQKQVKEVIIYAEENNQFIKDDVQRLFPKYNNVKFRCGNFEDVLKDIPVNSSYMLSDINKVITMADCGKLTMASVIIPYDFAYNYVIDEKGKKVPAVNFEYLGKDHLFKVHFFNACYQ